MIFLKFNYWFIKKIKEEITMANINLFIEQFRNRTLPKFFLSEAIPEFNPNDTVHKIVG